MYNGINQSINAGIALSGITHAEGNPEGRTDREREREKERERDEGGRRSIPTPEQQSNNNNQKMLEDKRAIGDRMIWRRSSSSSSRRPRFRGVCLILLVAAAPFLDVERPPRRLLQGLGLHTKGMRAHNQQLVDIHVFRRSAYCCCWHRVRRDRTQEADVGVAVVWRQRRGDRHG